MEALTDRQSEILKILRTESGRGQFPTIKQIANKLGINVSAVHNHLRSLQKKGWMYKQNQFALTEMARPDSSTFPLVATIPAGVPIEAFDQNDRTIQFSHEFFSKGNLKAVRISGDSMSGDQICDDDIGIIELTPHIGKNDIGVVRVEKDEVTLKRVAKHKNRVELIPSNPKYKTREYAIDDVEVLGRLVGIVRRT